MIKRFLKDSALYTLANLFTKGIAFIMLPVYLSYLSKTDYGILDYITTVGLVLGVVVALEIAQAVIRFSSESENNPHAKAKYINAGLTFTLGCYSLLLILVHLNLESVAHFLTESAENKTIASLSVFSYFSLALMYLSTVIYRSNLNAKSATLSSAVAAAITSIITYLLLSHFSMGLEGVLWGVIIGQLSVAIINLFNLRAFWLVPPCWETLKEMLKFSSPLVISSLGVVFATFADRLMIKEMLDFSELGEYSVAARIASGMTLLTIGFQSALAPLIYSQLDNPDTPRNLNKLLRYYVVIGIGFILVAFLISEPLIVLLAGEGYSKAPDILVILSFSVLLSSAYLFFPGLSIARKTHVLAGINIFSGVLNLLLNLIFIPKFGIYGAGLATVTSSFVSLLLNIFYSEKHFPILINVKE
ncbi:oligosaccharide flippase family protein [Pseudoalteromonas viridis]|uniref:Oligosaccharide flippase family protein n=1 Tax=Pseudoalteromonas viridis TaxID=339617 RepID=A0ABX7V8U7_9GAMM|nr:oligosaccharide flippase family protein [Pseudoalteromonas viridis]QTL36087.1 oligosaccharide flippase family protein [Pseudoalteromonas viridis]